MNEGIIAQRVDAEVVAVGRSARATTVAGSEGREELRDAVLSLMAAARAIEFSAEATRAVQGLIRELKGEIETPNADPDRIAAVLGRMAAALKKTGVVLSEAYSLAGPVGRIANAIGRTLVDLGWV